MSDDALVDTVTTGRSGRVYLPLESGDYYAVETESAKGFKLDDTPIYFTVKDGETTRKTVTNAPSPGYSFARFRLRTEAVFPASISCCITPGIPPSGSM